MSSLLRNHEAQQFRIRMQHCATETGLRLNAVNDGSAQLKFDLGKGRSQAIRVVDVGDRLRFVAHVVPEFESVDDVPDFLSTNLLQENNGSRLGYWTLYKNSSGVLNYMIDYTVPEVAVTPSFFKQIMVDILGHCETYYDFLDSLG
ncbi:hypothetical protein [Deinococcus sp. JMULE3]|uniref:hypothetical protein n=1 Tax=Deinococcus sp. JMULE3 TaxID=2518341 RepID=UPI0015770096|nr:hypothetical protein [Deinococcus sp. JMULE3]NTY00449.1 hypothetical protein [Deinococcus sp. JMULE3]